MRHFLARRASRSVYGTRPLAIPHGLRCHTGGREPRTRRFRPSHSRRDG
jgi:hypothetical protein